MRCAVLTLGVLCSVTALAAPVTLDVTHFGEGPGVTLVEFGFDGDTDWRVGGAVETVTIDNPGRVYYRANGDDGTITGADLPDLTGATTLQVAASDYRLYGAPLPSLNFQVDGGSTISGTVTAGGTPSFIPEPGTAALTALGLLLLSPTRSTFRRR